MASALAIPVIASLFATQVAVLAQARSVLRACVSAHHGARGRRELQNLLRDGEPHQPAGDVPPAGHQQGVLRAPVQLPEDQGPEGM